MDSTDVESNATYYSRYIAMGADMLTISKDVIHGSQQDNTRNWNFSFQLWNQEGYPYTGMLEVVASPNGTGVLESDDQGWYHISLCHMQDYVLGIPQNMTLIIQEDDVPDDFICAVSVNNSSLQYENALSLQVSDQDALLFCNLKNPHVPTGIHQLKTDWTLLMAGGCLMTVSCIRIHRRKK